MGVPFGLNLGTLAALGLAELRGRSPGGVGVLSLPVLDEIGALGLAVAGETEGRGGSGTGGDAAAARGAVGASPAFFRLRSLDFDASAVASGASPADRGAFVANFDLRPLAFCVGPEPVDASAAVRPLAAFDRVR